MATSSASGKGLEALTNLLTGQESLHDTLTKVSLIAVEELPSCDLASITVIKNGEPTTPAFTDKAALDLDEAQYDAEDGPCLSALRHQGIEEVDIAAELRWPDFVAAAVDLEVEGVLSIPLVAGEQGIGALNLYSRSTATFGSQELEQATVLADELAIGVSSAVAYTSAFELSEHLREAMVSRAVIEQAKGMLMATHHCTPEEAFEILRRASLRENRKLREIAVDIVEARLD